MIVELTYPAILHTTIETPALAGEAPGVPFYRTARALKIYVREAAYPRIEGYYGDPAHPFRLDPGLRWAEAGARRIPLGPARATRWNGELYLAPEVWTDLFGLRFRYEPRRLRLQLIRSETIPVYARLAHRQRREAQGIGGPPPAPAPARPHLLDGATIDWTLDIPQLERPDEGLRRASYRLDLGFELLGGEATFRTAGRADRPVFDTPPQGTWFWHPEGWRWLTEAGGGTVASVGLRPFALRGVRAGNAPPFRAVTFQTVAVDEQGLVPGAEVEAYLDDRLVDVRTVGPDGRVGFDLPARYGTSLMRLDVLGPHGEVEHRTTTWNLPLTVLGAGQLEWRAALGQAVSDDWQIAGDVDLQGGLTDRLTLRGGTSLARALRAGRPAAWHADPYASAVFRVVAPLVLSAQAVYADAWSLAASGQLGVQTLTLLYEAALPARQDPLRDRLDASTQLTFDVAASVLGLRGGYRLERRRGGGTGETVQLGLSFTVGPYTALADLARRRAAGQPPAWNLRLEASALVPLPGLPAWSAPYVSASLFLDPEAGEAETAGARVITPTFFQLFHLEGSWQRDLRQHADRWALGITLDVDEVYGQTRVQGTGRGEVRAAQRLSGSVVADLRHGAVLASRLPATNRGYVRGTVYQVTRPHWRRPVPGVRVRTDDGRSATTDRKGHYLIADLTGFDKVVVEVEPGSIPDPSLVPAARRREVWVRPGHAVDVDFTLLPTGLVSGEVYRGRGKARQPLPGLAVTARRGQRTWEGQTYSDGGFYLYQLPPGRYELVLDGGQLRRLGLRDPGPRRFRLGVEEGGAEAGPIVWELEPRRARRSRKKAHPQPHPGDERRRRRTR